MSSGPWRAATWGDNHNQYTCGVYSVNQSYDSFVDNVFSLIYKPCFRANHFAKVDAATSFKQKSSKYSLYC